MKLMNEFKAYHPVVNFLWFAAVCWFSCVLMNPICLAISFVSVFSYSVMLMGKKALKNNILYMLPMLFALSVLNPVFSHEGVTVLSYFPNGNPLTLESILYGIAAAVMICSVICLFSCYNEIMTSDKIICLFGKIIPSLSLIFSMTLRFVPMFSNHLKEVSRAQKCIGRDLSAGSLPKRVKCGLSVLSVTVTWALENAIETADSMKSRGYGLPKRTAYSLFKWDRRDIISLFWILLLSLVTLFGSQKIKFYYFPSVKMSEFSLFWIVYVLAYLMLCTYPIIIEVRGIIKWNALKSKM